MTSTPEEAGLSPLSVLKFIDALEPAISRKATPASPAAKC